jgi:hypothetical protein
MTGTGPTDQQQLMAALGRATGFPRWVWWIVYALPLLFLLIGIGALVEAVLFTTGASKTRGTVVDVAVSRDSDGGAAYTPLIAYRSADGQAHTGATHISSGGYDYSRGDQVDILYEAADPDVVRIDSFFSLYGFGLIFAAVGGVFVTLLRFVRRSMLRPGGPLARRLEQAAAEGSARRSAADPTPKPTEPRTTDPSEHGHAHDPKPKPAETVRRMR